MRASSDTDPDVRRYRAQLDALQEQALADTEPDEDSLTEDDTKGEKEKDV